MEICVSILLWNSTVVGARFTPEFFIRDPPMKRNTFVNGITFEKWNRLCSDTKNWKVDRTQIYFANNADSKCLPSTLAHSSKCKTKSSKKRTHWARVIFFTSAIMFFFNKNSLCGLFAYTSDFKCPHTKKSGAEGSIDRGSHATYNLIHTKWFDERRQSGELPVFYSKCALSRHLAETRC